MTALVEPLPWDTEFFGFSIGRVDLDGATPESLEKIDAEAREQGIVCLYGTLDPAGLTAAYVVQEHGHRLVEVAILFSRPAIPYEGPPTRSVARTATLDDLALLDAEIRTIAAWSRYAADPRFGPEASRRMHVAWAERAIRDDDRMLGITEDESGVTGFSTQRLGDPPNIDLMGVTKPGTGASHALMAAFIDWAGPRPVTAGPCAARNIAVNRFLERGKFSVTRCRYLFHRWLDEDTGA